MISFLRPIRAVNWGHTRKLGHDAGGELGGVDFASVVLDRGDDTMCNGIRGDPFRAGCRREMRVGHEAHIADRSGKDHRRAHS
jgi:hypothetical protein